MTLNQITDEFFPMSAYLSGSAGKEYTYFDGAIHVDNLDSYYGIVKEMLFNPGFRKEDFERIRTDLIRSIQDSLYDDGFVAARAFDLSVFEDHPYSKPNAGMIDTLNALTVNDVKDFYEAKYTKQNIIVGLAGGVPESFVAEVMKDVQRLSSGPVDKEPVAAPPAKLTSNAIIIQQAATQATTVTFGYSLPVDLMTRGHPEYAALRIALRHYGDGSFTSRLMSEIRVKRGINYGNSAGLRFEGLALEVYIGAADTTESAHFATRMAMYELNKVIEDGLTQEDFEFVRNRWFNVLPVAVDTPAHVLSLAIEGHEYGFGDDYLSYMQGQLSNLTLADVNAAARKWLQDESVTYVFVTPNATDLKARLIDGTTSVPTYSTDVVPENVTAIDDIVKDYPLGLDASNVEITTADELFPGVSTWTAPIEQVANEQVGAPGQVAVGREGPTDEKELLDGDGFDLTSDSQSLGETNGETNSGVGALFSSYSALCGIVLSSLSILVWL